MIKAEFCADGRGDLRQQCIQIACGADGRCDLGDGLELPCTALVLLVCFCQFDCPFFDALLQVLQQFPQAGGHSVERPGKGADLILRVDRCLRTQVPFHNAVGNSCQAYDRCGNYLANGKTDQDRHQEQESHAEHKGPYAGLKLGLRFQAGSRDRPL